MPFCLSAAFRRPTFLGDPFGAIKIKRVRFEPPPVDDSAIEQPAILADVNPIG